MDFVQQPLPVSIAELAHDPGRVLEHLRAAATHGILDVQGAQDLVIVPLAAYQALADRLEELETLAALSEASSEIDRGEGSPAVEALARLQARLESRRGHHP